MSTSNTYGHHALSGDSFIRLLILKAATSTEAELHCELVEVDQPVAAEYEALSYVWGKDEFPNVLHLPTGYLMITDNLASALRRLRLTDKSRTLWVDAVCINQSNNAEKERQVAQMANIYQNATNVVAWLGETTGTSFDKDAIINLSEHAQEISLRSPTNENREVLRKWFYGNSERGKWTMDVSNIVKGANFPSIYESAWFTRMWIVQEALLASHLTLYFASDTLDWVDFEKVMILIHTVNATIKLPIPSQNSFIKYAWSLVEVRNHWRRLSEGNLNQASEVAYYMNQLRRRSCKDDRDRVFALRGLLRDESNLIIQPDYSKSVSQIYTELTRSQLTLGNIGVLYDAGLWKRKSFHMPNLESEHSNQTSWLEYLPTWVPDYRHGTAFMELDPHFGSHFGLDPRVPLKLDMSKEPYRLTSQATLLDIVTFVQPALFMHDPSLRANDIAMFFMCRQFFRDLKRIVDTSFSNRSYPTDEDPTTAFAWALVGGGTDEAYNKDFNLRNPNERPDPLSLWNIYEKCCLEENGEVHHAMQREADMTGDRRTIRGVGIEFYSKGSQDSGTAWTYHYHLLAIFRRHWFFMSDDGYMGLVPRNDYSNSETHVLAFIDGANVPFVLRDLGDSASDCLLIGPCYIHGLMDSEAVKRNSAFSEGTIQII